MARGIMSEASAQLAMLVSKADRVSESLSVDKRDLFLILPPTILPQSFAAFGYEIVHAECGPAVGWRQLQTLGRDRV